MKDEAAGLRGAKKATTSRHVRTAEGKSRQHAET